MRTRHRRPSVKSIKRWWVIAVGLGGLSTACVRLAEPDHFVCNSDVDCEQDQRCRSASCVPKDYCSSTADCGSGQHCAAQRCVADECDVSTQATACKGFRCVLGACASSCAFPGDCASGFLCRGSACVPGSLTADGGDCRQDGECDSNHCCATAAGSTCRAVCPAKAGAACSKAMDCASGNCCTAQDGKLSCSDVPCAALPECATSDDCSADRTCQLQRCVARLAPGSPCTLDDDCSSLTCESGLCRGTATGGSACSADTDCEAARVCCPLPKSSRTCSQLDRGCPGTIGDACDDDSECIDGDCDGAGGFCTKGCTTDADCGTSRWGAPNVCNSNASGKACFPGCKSSGDCYVNLDISYECVTAGDGRPKLCSKN